MTFEPVEYEPDGYEPVDTPTRPPAARTGRLWARFWRTLTGQRDVIAQLRARRRTRPHLAADGRNSAVTADTTPDDTTARLAQIHDRNRRLAAVPWELHDGDHGPACIPCELVRAVGDVSWLLELVNEQQREAFATALDTGPAVWCWNRHPDHPLHCGRFAGHEGPHIRGERSWEDVAPQQPEDGDRG